MRDDKDELGDLADWHPIFESKSIDGVIIICGKSVNHGLLLKFG